MDFGRERRCMVEDQLIARGIEDGRVLAAMGKVPRECFVPEGHQSEAYQDHPLPIGEGQTISQPYMVALMTASLDPRPGDRVLEVGTGSGYQAAILDAMGARVYTMERFPHLAHNAMRALERCGIFGVKIRVGDGSLGWPEEAPFDGILVTASAPETPRALVDQLAPDGRLVIPVGAATSQSLKVVERRGQAVNTRVLCECAFVPLVGGQGWKEEEGEGHR